MCSHFITKDGKQYTTFSTYFIISRKVKTHLKHTHTHTHKTCVVYGEDTMTDQTWQKWFAKFRAGDFLLIDAPWSGRAVEVDSIKRRH